MKIFLAAILLTVLLPVPAWAGLLWGPNNRTVVHNYGGAAPAVAYYPGDGAVIMPESAAPVYSAGTVVEYSAVSAAGSRKNAKRAAKHAGKAAKHQSLADYYSGK